MRPSSLLPALALAALALPSEALACGGFFCGGEPMDQSKERIVFGIDEVEGKVDVHVQIFYQGTADEFAWVVPVPELPTVDLSSDALFQQLSWQTQPNFFLNWREEGDCLYDDGGGFWYGPEGDFDAAADAESPPQAGGDRGVEVIEQRQVGPYDQVTLRAETQTALLTWLQDNDYDIPDEVGDALAPYISQKAYFVALKLTSGNDTGDIAPLRMSYAGTSAMIPIVLTSIAATPDMRLEPYVFASRRAVPDNYLHVRINEAAIDWFSWGSNYEDVITQAANEAGGQAFATDFAGATAPLRGMLYREGQYNLPALSRITNPAQFLDAMLSQGFPRTSQVQNLIRDYIEMPASAVAAGIDESSWYNCLECYPNHPPAGSFDPVAFTEALDEVVVQPLMDAEALFTTHSYLTRMTSSMSPEEMTADPYFVLNGDMGDVSNQRSADLVVDCGDGLQYVEAPRYLELTDGRRILMPSLQWEWENGTSSLLADLGGRAAIAVEDTSGSGLPVIVQDLSGEAADDAARHNKRFGDIYAAAGIDIDDEALAAAGCEGGGCATGAGAPGGAAGGAFAVGLLGLLARRRR